MGRVVTAPFDPLLASSLASAAVPLAVQTGKDPITWTRGAVLEYALACALSAELVLSAAQIRPPINFASKEQTFGEYDKQVFALGSEVRKISTDVDITQGVPPATAAAAHYLAFRRSMRNLVKSRSKGSGLPMIDHEIPQKGEGAPFPFPLPGVPGLPFPGVPSGTVNLPGMGPIPIPVVPPTALAGLEDDDLAAIPAILVVACLGVVGIAAAAWTVADIANEREVQATKRAEVETSAKVKLATDLCAASAAAGKPCDVPRVVAELAHEELNRHDFATYGIAAGAVVLVVGVGYYALSGAGHHANPRRRRRRRHHRRAA